MTASGLATAPGTRSVRRSRLGVCSRGAVPCGHAAGWTTLGLAPLAGDLARVETGAARRRSTTTTASSARSPPTWSRPAASASGPTLTLCAGVRRHRRRRPGRRDDAVTGAVAVELVHLGSLYHDDVIDEAETRRGVPSVNARWSNIVAILAGDFLLARASALAASLGADVAAPARRHDRRAVPRPGARAPAPLRRRPHRGDLRLRDRGQDRVAVRHVVPHRRDGERRRRAHARRAHARSATTSGCASRSSTTCSTSPRPTTTLGKPAGQDLVEGVYTLPVIYALAASPDAAGPARRARSTPTQLDRGARARHRERCGRRRARRRARPRGEGRRGARRRRRPRPEVTGGLRRLVDGLVTRDR